MTDISTNLEEGRGKEAVNESESAAEETNRVLSQSADNIEQEELQFEATRLNVLRSAHIIDDDDDGDADDDCIKKKESCQNPMQPPNSEIEKDDDTKMKAKDCSQEKYPPTIVDVKPNSNDCIICVGNGQENQAPDNTTTAGEDNIGSTLENLSGRQGGNTDPAAPVMPGAIRMPQRTLGRLDTPDLDITEVDLPVVDPPVEASTDLMIEAKLVENEGVKEFVLAKPAREGYDALIHNKRFKVLITGFILLIIVIVVSVVLLVPKTTGEWTQIVVNNSSAVECGTTSRKQADYRGTLNVTETGKACMRWDSQDPHTHDRTPENYLLAGLEDNNYCRNPDKGAKAWCYTVDPNSRWEYCDVPYCDGLPTRKESSTCGTLTISQVDYRGTINVTSTGKTCQDWSSFFPHFHDNAPENKPKANLNQNFCRNPDGEEKAWCYTTDPKTRWEFCDVPACEDEIARTEACYNCSTDLCGTASLDQTDYIGNVDVTESGRQCQRWDQQEPHAHNTPYNASDSNFCRSHVATFRGGRAWCYTTDPEVISEFCSVPFCAEASTSCGKSSVKQADYRGDLSQTVSGKTCQSWSSQTPHNHSHSPQTFPTKDLSQNYCRNPDDKERAWCYTTDPDTPWEFCGVPSCSSSATQEVILSKKDCGSAAKSQADYRGSLSTTATGRSCQRWDNQWPHLHEHLPGDFPGLEENFCRNPDGSPTAWCYTNDPEVRKEACAVPFCEILEYGTKCGTKKLKQQDYRGQQNTTINGRTCQRWDSQVPVAHKYNFLDYPLAGLEENYCRNPDGGDAAWCFTTDPTVPWEHCDVPYCSRSGFNEDCGTSSLRHSDYRGKLNTTESGKTCQEWVAQEPHKHKTTPAIFPLASLEHNYCRNPDGSARAWCYTTDPNTLWDYCDVPTC